MNTASELEFFVLLARQGSLAAAARELHLTAPALSKRLAQLEARLGVRLVQRTTRRMSLTAEGEVFLARARTILEDIRELENEVAGSKAAPRGRLRINATLGFGRSHIAPLVSEFVRQHPAVEVQLQLTDRPLNLAEQGFDLGLRFGEPPDAR
ncbi:MAG: LysR family transcriptional regulator, partial [Betaproteobacteria bacterium]